MELPEFSRGEFLLLAEEVDLLIEVREGALQPIIYRQSLRVDQDVGVEPWQRSEVGSY